MPITLTPSLMDWLQAEVAAGRYASVELAVQAIVTGHIIEVSQERAAYHHLTQDSAWTAGLIDQVRSKIAQGEPETLAAFATFVRGRTQSK